MNSLELHDVVFRVDEKALLSGVSLALPAGQLYSVVGPNGAGKSTLLKLVARVLQVSSGGIQIAGRDIREISAQEHAQLIGYVPQTLETDYSHTALDFVLMGLYPVLQRWAAVQAEHEQAALEALAAVGMSAFSHRLINTLSGGERQRVLLAAALVHRPRLLLLDEPTSFLDPHHEQEIAELLRSLRAERGVSVLAVTHQLNACALQSDGVVGLRDGQVVFSGSPRELMQACTLQAIFDFTFQLVPHPTTGLNMVVPSL